MEIKSNYKFLSFILIFLASSSFFLGFYLDENSAGGGSYLGDWGRAWPNIQIFLNHDISTAINHEVFETNRSPLLYILHGLFNPFAGTEIRQVAESQNLIKPDQICTITNASEEGILDMPQWRKKEVAKLRNTFAM